MPLAVFTFGAAQECEEVAEAEGDMVALGLIEAVAVLELEGELEDLGLPVPVGLGGDDCV